MGRVCYGVGATMKRQAWRETGDIVRKRWRTCLSKHAIAAVDRIDGKNFDPRDYLIEFPFAWLADGFASGYDPSRFSLKNGVLPAPTPRQDRALCQKDPRC